MMARSIFSLGMFSFLPASIAVRRRGLEFGSPPPILAAMVISRITLVKTRPRFASVAAFLCLMVAHFECPDMTHPLFYRVPGLAGFTLGEISCGRAPPAWRLGNSTPQGGGSSVRRLRVNRKPLRNRAILAQPPCPRKHRGCGD